MAVANLTQTSAAPPSTSNGIIKDTRVKPLCSSCNGIVSWIKSLDRKEDEDKKLPFQPSFEALQASALSCPLCSFVLDEVFRQKTVQAGWNGDKGEEPFKYTVYIRAERDLRRGIFRICWREEPLYPSPYLGNSEYYYISNSNNNFEKISWQQRELTFESRLKTVSEWLSDCKRNHSLCAEGKADLPGRLLDLATVEATRKVKLVESRTLGTALIQHATLSHCWGPPTSKPPLRTVGSNLADHFDGIPLDHLTLNFRDAVLTCGKLGLRYIWIDSLCIIQDSKADWEIEAGKMADIYRGSYINIAAAAARDAHGGFIAQSSLTKPEARFKTIKHLVAAPTGTGLTNPTEGTLLIQRDFGAGEHRQLSDEIYPYFGRGWVLQELALSPRTVLFPKGQIFWQCRHRFGSEDDTVWSDQFRSIANGGQSVSGFDLGSPPAALKTWNLWLESYSQRRLTYASDVAPAIAGLVSFFGKETNHSPVLGLWKETLGFDLGWSLSYRHENKPPPKKFREGQFPSWSWLSVLPQADLAAQLLPSAPYKHNVVSLRVKNWEEKWEGSPYTSKLKKSRLIVSSMIRDATLYIPSNGQWRGSSFIIKSSGTPNWSGHFSSDYLFDPNSKLDVKMIQLYQNHYRNASNASAGAVLDQFLVVRRSADGSNSFYRIGVGSVHTEVKEGMVQDQHCERHFKNSERDCVELV